MRFGLFILFGILVLSCQSPERNFSTKKEFFEPIGLINDYENILSEQEKTSLKELIEAFNERSQMTLVLLTSADMYSYENPVIFATDVANEWGIGDSERNDGLMLFVSKNERSVAIAVGLGIENIFSDIQCKEIIDIHMIPNFKEGNYYNGIEACIHQLNATWEGR